MPALDLVSLAGLPPDEQEEAILTAAASLIAEGASEEQFGELEALVDEFYEMLQQRARPH